MDKQTELILWAWIRTLFKMLTDEQRKKFAIELEVELKELRKYYDLTSQD